MNDKKHIAHNALKWLTTLLNPIAAESDRKNVALASTSFKTVRYVVCDYGVFHNIEIWRHSSRLWSERSEDRSVFSIPRDLLFNRFGGEPPES